MRRVSLNRDGIIPWARVLHWMQKRKWGEHQHPSLSLSRCFLFVGVQWSDDSDPYRYAFFAVMDCVPPEVWAKRVLHRLSCFCWVFCHSKRRKWNECTQQPVNMSKRWEWNGHLPLWVLGCRRKQTQSLLSALWVCIWDDILRPLEFCSKESWIHKSYPNPPPPGSKGVRWMSGMVSLVTSSLPKTGF